MSYDREATNKDLAELCEVLDVEVKAKNPVKPTKSELTEALDGYYGVNADSDEPVVAVSGEVKSKAQKRREQYEENMKLVRVLVTSNATNQTKTELTTIGWGNRLLGYHHTRVVFGKPWHVHQGALNNLRDRKLTIPVQNEEHNRIDYVTMPAYNIVDLGLLTMDEYRAMADKQKVKAASLDIQ